MVIRVDKDSGGVAEPSVAVSEGLEVVVVVSEDSGVFPEPSEAVVVDSGA